MTIATHIDTTTIYDLSRGSDDALRHVHLHVSEIDQTKLKLFRTTLPKSQVTATYRNFLKEAVGEDTAQYLNCSCCRGTIKRLGNLVTIQEDGTLVPLLWPLTDEPKTALELVHNRMHELVATSEIDSVWKSDAPRIGTPTTPGKEGKTWSHIYVDIPQGSVVRPTDGKTANELIQLSIQRFKTLFDHKTGIWPIKLETLQTALRLFEGRELNQSENFVAVAQFHGRIKELSKNRLYNRNLLWKALADAPNGWENVNSTMVGQLYEWIGQALPLADIKRMWNSRVHPARYQRPVAAPSVGTLKQAEDLIAKMGLTQSLERRFARLEELRLTWRPTVKEGPVKAGGVFAHIAAKDAPVDTSRLYELSPKAITWEKFSETVLPKTTVLQMQVPSFGNFAGFLTATHADAPPILSWDTLEDRYPISTYLYISGSRADQWGLTANAMVDVTGISQIPGQSEGLILILDGAADTNTEQGLGLFPAILKDDLHGVRSVMEAFSKAGKLTGQDEASACGYQISTSSCGILVVATVDGEPRKYHIDRFD